MCFHAWLAIRDRCWTADRPLQRGLQSHTLCPMCLAENETMNHLNLQCSFARAVWGGLIQRLGVTLPIPDRQDQLALWWPGAVRQLSSRDQRTANSLIMLVIRTLWLERNVRVFEGQTTQAGRITEMVAEEWRIWATSRCGRVRE